MGAEAVKPTFWDTPGNIGRLSSDTPANVQTNRQPFTFKDHLSNTLH